MKPITRECVDRAEADYETAMLMRRSRKKHSRDVACFHLQQCAEEYLKGRLNEAGIAFPKSRGLKKLLALVATIEPLWDAFRPSLIAISDRAAECLYPGHAMMAAEAKELLASTARIRKLARLSLGLR
jgi:HEPN domain-containing protein